MLNDQNVKRPFLLENGPIYPFGSILISTAQITSPCLMVCVLVWSFVSRLTAHMERNGRTGVNCIICQYYTCKYAQAIMLTVSVDLHVINNFHIADPKCSHN